MILESRISSTTVLNSDGVRAGICANDAAWGSACLGAHVMALDGAPGLAGKARVVAGCAR